MTDEEFVEERLMAQRGGLVSQPFVTFAVVCPFCHEEMSLPPVSLTPVMEMNPAGNYLSVRVGDIPSVRHACTWRPS